MCSERLSSQNNADKELTKSIFFLLMQCCSNFTIYLNVVALFGLLKNAYNTYMFLFTELISIKSIFPRKKLLPISKIRLFRSTGSCLNDQATLLEYNTLKGVYQIRVKTLILFLQV